jgi:hypothetical protein
MKMSMEPKHLRKNAKYLRKALMKRLESVSDYDVDDMLGFFGLRRNPRPASRFFSGFALVVGGVAVGVAAGMLLAPRRRSIQAKLQQAGSTIRQQAHHAT